MGVCVKALHGAVGTPETVFFRGAVAGLVLLAIHLVTGVPLRMASPRIMVLRVFAGALSLLCYYGSIAWEGHGALATANLLLKTAPVWVALGAGFLLGESASTRTWIALAVGLAGATIALLGPIGDVGGRGSIVLGLLSGIFAAAAYLSVRFLATSEDPLAVVTLFSVGLAIVMAPVVLWRWKPLPEGRGLWLVLGVTFCGTVAQYLMTHAYRHGQAAIVAVSGLAEVGFAVAAAIVLFGESPGPWTFTGGGLAALAGLVATWPRRERSR